MKKIINILLIAVLVLGATSCANEAPFKSGDEGQGFGKVLTSSLAVKLQDARTRGEKVYVNDCSVKFYNT